jgi:hypothetical protein
LRDFLELLHSDVLRKAVMWWLPNANVELLLRFQQLQALLLHDSYSLPKSSSALLNRLPALRSLELHASTVDELAWKACLELTQLTRLALEPFCYLTAGFEELPEGNLLHLTRLQQLRELRITHRHSQY